MLVDNSVNKITANIISVDKMTTDVIFIDTMIVKIVMTTLYHSCGIMPKLKLGRCENVGVLRRRALFH